MNESTKAAPLSPEELLEKVRASWTCGRPIVPIIGAGFSVDSGMPALASIVRYLAKLRAMLCWGLYGPQTSHELFGPYVERFFKDPSVFIDAFGWPDRFQLNADVSRRLRNNKSGRWNKEYEKACNDGNEVGLLQWAIHNELDKLAKAINPIGTLAFANLNLTHLDKVLRIASAASDGVDSIVGKSLRSESARLNDVLHWYDSLLYQVCADWKPLLREVTGYRSDLIDALFGRLARERLPGNSHLFLAHLVQLTRIKTIFTYNFDELIEAGLDAESVPHRVFAMEYGAQLPQGNRILFRFKA